MRPDSRHYGFVHWYVRLSGEKNRRREAAKIEDRRVWLCKPGAEPFPTVTQATAADIKGRIRYRVSLCVEVSRTVIGATVTAPVLSA
jgi:hypothetical protein